MNAIAPPHAPTNEMNLSPKTNTLVLRHINSQSAIGLIGFLSKHIGKFYKNMFFT